MHKDFDPSRFMQRRIVLRYALGGVLFGCCFPLAAWILDIQLLRLPYHWDSLLYIHQLNLVHFLIDATPLVLGLLFTVIGVKQAHLERYTADLERMVAERTLALREAEIAHEQLRRQQQFRQDVLDIDPSLIFVKDGNGRFVLANRALADTYGTTVEHLIGKTDADFNPDMDQTSAYLEADRKMIASGQQVFIPEERITTAQGDLRWLQTVKRPIHVPNSDAIHVLGIATDITDRKRLIETEQKARVVAEGQKHILGMMTQGEPMPRVLEEIALFLERQLPEALCSILILEGMALRHGAAPGLAEAYSAVIDGILIGPEVGSCGTAAYWKKPVIVSDIAADPLWAAFAELALSYDLRACWSWPILARDGAVLGTFAVYHRIPHHPSEEELACVRQATDLVGIALERHRREEALLRSEEQFRRSFEDAGIGMTLAPIDGPWMTVNEAFARMLGYTQEEMVARGRDQLTHPEDLPPFLEWHRSVREEGHRQPFVQTKRYLHRDGSTVWALLNVAVICDEHDQPHLLLGQIQDVTEARQYEERLQTANEWQEEAIEQLTLQQAELREVNLRLEALATTDPLTSLKNHRAFQEKLAEEFTRSQRYGHPLSLIMIDVDEFKSYNDAFGHPTGDVLLKELAAVLQRGARATDCVARYGGEEFLLVLPEADKTIAVQIGERIRQTVEEHGWPHRAITISMGVATFAPEMDTAQMLIDLADKALYYSKRQGRNRCTHATELPTAVLNLSVDSTLLRDELLRHLHALTGSATAAALLPPEAAPLSLEDTFLPREDTLLQAYESSIGSWSRLLDLKDKETEGHSERVTEMTMRLARFVGMNEQEVQYAKWGALLHDIGKIGIPDSILLKPGSLTEEEWVVMRQHPTIAYEMMTPISFLHPALDIPYCHHEKWDGSGYPRGLAGEEIPLAARLFAVIDVYDALRSDRPYRSAWPEERVREYLLAQSGTHFDPYALGAFLAMLVEASSPAGEQKRAA